jgi:peptidyl-prolyl cis-trans isomerase SurA
MAVAMLAAALGRGEVVDRLAVSVESAAILESEILDHLWVAAFLEGKPLDVSARARRAAANQLIELALIHREMQLSRYTPPGVEIAKPLLEKFRAEHYPVAAEYQAALAKHNLREADLLRNLLLQVTITRFVNFRFRPGVRVTEEEVAEYYRSSYVPGWESVKAPVPVPPLQDAQMEIEAILTEQKVDQAMDDWLKAARASVRITYQEEVFR